VNESRTVDLHDGASLIAADVAGLLPAAALAGAQVRSAAEQVAGLPAFDRPRALVVVGATAAVDACLLSAVIGTRAPAPVLAATALPGWVGALDIVVVLAASRDDLAAAEAAAEAGRRGARVVVRGPSEGPVAAAAGRDLLEPQMSLPEALAGIGRFALLAAVAAAAGLLPRPDFAGAAQQLDALALACHPSSEFFVNPALTLAEHLSAGTPLLIGTDPVADALAGSAVQSLAALAGYAGSFLGAGQAATSPPVIARAAARGGSGAAGDLFYDPYDDASDGAAGQQISPVLVVGPSAHGASGPLTGTGLMRGGRSLEPVPFGAGPPPARSALAAALEAALPRALSIGPEELPETGDRIREDPDEPDRFGAQNPSLERDLELGAAADGLPQRDAFTWTVVMMSRIDFAAVYLGLLTGARPPMDSPDGLGRTGRAAGRLPGAAAAGAWTETEPGSWS
jgi:hypothetical protein